MVTLSRPFPANHYDKLWAWLHEYPDNNFDDFGTRNFVEFCCEIDRRAEMEDTFLVRSHGAPVGAIGYIGLNSHLGMFHGICFAKAVHGKGIAAEAVKAVLNRAFSTGVYKVSAEIHADNLQVWAFLKKLGAAQEGLMIGHTLRNGKPIDKRLVSFFAHSFGGTI